MDETIHRLIAAISPDNYCQKEGEDEDGNIIKDFPKYIRKLIKEEGYTKASEKVKPIKSSDYSSYDYDKAKADALSLWGFKSPIEQHKLYYDSPTEGLEPVYFWLLDFLRGGLYDKVEKITDNFVASPGSGHFSELQGKATQMQQEVSRTMGNVNTVLKSVLNLVYDLKEFRIRLKPYKIYNSKDTSAEDKLKQLLSLKQIWLDNVDIRKGRGSINALSSGELDFVTLRDAFMSLKNSESISEIDLNDRVRRILQQRVQDFFIWIDESHNSLSQRYEIERNYLKSQVNMLKLYVRWVKPYLKSASKLEQNIDSKNPGLVNAFNTMILELKLLAYSEHKIKDDVAKNLVPELFKNVQTRKYYKFLVIDFEFRSIPQRVSQRGDWAFGGRVEIKFTSYGLNEDELKILKKELEKDDLGSALKLIQGATDDSLGQIQKDIDSILEGREDDEIKEDKKEKPKSGDDFGLDSLFSGFRKKKKKKNKIETDLSKGILPDSDYEKVIRSQAMLNASEGCFSTFDTYKKAHGMYSHSNPYDAL